ncbi:hypothetical protein AURDEDRAFT_169259 [Auricularia subglabra TFB-10046 SS5]|nr:hypothetical protein AURDEDRAFT_169259 [Auricularia subglabra TFB-10046 SS5]
MSTNESPATSTTGDAFSFSFEGVSVKLVVEPRSDHGRFAITLDGVSQEGRSYSAVSGCEVAYASLLLQPGRHTVLVTLLDDSGANSRSPSTSLQPHSFIYDTGNVKRSETSAVGAPSASPTDEVPDLAFAPKDNPGQLPRKVIGGIAFGVAGGVITITFAAFFLHRAYRRKHPLPETVEMKPAKKKSKRVMKFEQSYFMTPPPPSQKKPKRRRRSSARGPPPAVNLQLSASPPLPTQEGADGQAVKHQPSVASALSSVPDSVKAEPLTQQESEDVSMNETNRAPVTMGIAV